MARRDSGASSDDGPLTARITNEAFLCPIGCSTMRDPVFLADGHSYERANIDAWIERRHAASPWRVLPDRSALLRLAVWGWAALAVWAALSLLLYHEPAIQGLLLR